MQWNELLIIIIIVIIVIPIYFCKASSYKKTSITLHSITRLKTNKKTTMKQDQIK